MSLKLTKILNIGWIGKGDFGDEAMALALRKFLQKNNIRSITYYNQGKFPIHRDPNDLKIKHLHKFENLKWLKKILDNIYLRKYNTLIIGGGSLFHSFNSINWKFDIIEKLKKINPNNKIGCIGVSIGPFENLSAQQKCGKLLDNVNISVMRDRHSAEIGRNISTNTGIISSLDTSLALPFFFPEYFKHDSTQNQINNVVGVIFIDKNKPDVAADYFKKYLEVINDLLEKNNKIILFSLYTGDAYYDKELNQLLKMKSRSPENVEIHNFHNDIFKTIDELKRCSKIVSMRLHGIIFSYLLNIPFLSLAYNQKNISFCKTINYPDKLSLEFNDSLSIDTILENFKNLEKESDKIFSQTLKQTDATKLVIKNMETFLKNLSP